LKRESGKVKKLVCLLNKVTHSCIPLENFMAVDAQNCEKYVVVYQQNIEEATSNFSKSYPDTQVRLFVCPKQGVSKVFGLYRLLKSVDPDVVHAHHTSSSFMSAVMRFCLGYKLVVTAHSDFSRYSLSQKLALSVTYALGNELICNSKNTFASVPSFVRKSKMKVIYNGVNFSKTDAALAKVSSDKKTGLVVGTVCRLIPEKDLGTLIRSFAIFINRGGRLDSELRIIGGGSELPKLKNLVNSLGLDECVKFYGERSRCEAYEEMSKLDIFVVSSRFEGFCNAMVEAAGMGLAVIASNTGPLPEIMSDETCLFFEPGNEHNLADQLLSLSESASLRLHIGKKASLHVRQSYSLENSARKHSKIYSCLR